MENLVRDDFPDEIAALRSDLRERFVSIRVGAASSAMPLGEAAAALGQRRNVDFLERPDPLLIEAQSVLSDASDIVASREIVGVVERDGTGGYRSVLSDGKVRRRYAAGGLRDRVDVRPGQGEIDVLFAILFPDADIFPTELFVVETALAHSFSEGIFQGDEDVFDPERIVNPVDDIAEQVGVFLRCDDGDVYGRS